jgi:hypothetical protein
MWNLKLWNQHVTVQLEALLKLKTRLEIHPYMKDI